QCTCVSRETNERDTHPPQPLLLVAKPFSLFPSRLPSFPHRHRRINGVITLQVDASKRCSLRRRRCCCCFLKHLPAGDESPSRVIVGISHDPSSAKRGRG